MRLSLFTDYSLRVLMFAAMREGSFALRDAADAYGISRHHLVKVVNHLSRLDYLETRRGRGGGIILKSAPEAIRLGDLVRATENQPPLVECFDPATQTCPIRCACRLKGILERSLAAFYDELNAHTLADLVTPSARRQLRPLLLSPALS